MGITEKQAGLVKEAWEIVQQNIPQYSLRLFILLVEAAPETKNMFSFLRDSDEIPENNPKLRAHAIKIFKLAGESCVQLLEKGTLVGNPTFKHLGSVHLMIGATDSHFKVVGDALLRTIQEAVGEKWSDEMEGAWGEVYDQLAAAIQAEMKP